MGQKRAKRKIPIKEILDVAGNYYRLATKLLVKQ